MKNNFNSPPIKGWVWTRLGEVADICSGYGFPEKYQGKLQGEIPFFKVGDISKAVMNGNIYLKKAENYISTSNCKELKAKPLKDGTIVFAKIGEAIKLNRRVILGQDSLVDNNIMGVYSIFQEQSKLFIFYFLLQ